MIAQQHDVLVEATDVRVAPSAVGVEAPFEHGSRDVERAGDDPVALAVQVCANVDQEGALFVRGACFGRLEPLDSRSRSFQQLFKGSRFVPSATIESWLGAGKCLASLHLKPPQPAALADQAVKRSTGSNTGARARA